MELQLWKDREKKSLDHELFSTKAERFAIITSQDAKDSKDKLNKGTQLRKFYDEILRLNLLAQADRENWDMILPQVYMIIAKAAYAKGRKLISKNFLDHLRQGIQQIKSIDDLRVFTNYMEAFMGFYKMYNDK